MTNIIFTHDNLQFLKEICERDEVSIDIIVNTILKLYKDVETGVI